MDADSKFNAKNEFEVKKVVSGQNVTSWNERKTVAQGHVPAGLEDDLMNILG